MFNRYKNKIKKLEEDLIFQQKHCDNLQNIINELKKERDNLKAINHQLNNQLINMSYISKENEIMRKYYKLDEELSQGVQAKVLVDLKLHDMEFKMLQENFKKSEEQLSFYSNLLFFSSLQYPFFRYY